MANFTEFNKWIVPFLKTNLAKDLVYHDIQHTLFVCENAKVIARHENVNEKDLKLVKTAALLHDVGFVKMYAGHEKEGCVIAHKYLPTFNYTFQEIEKICGMIMATFIPQRPHNLLEKIIADADLMYFGTEKYSRISNLLFEELKFYKKIKTQEEWKQLQISFLEAHHFHTDYCVHNLTPKKLDNLKNIKAT